MANDFPDKAIIDLNRALQLKPGFPQAYSNRGNAYLRKGQISLAILDFSQAKTILPFWLVLISIPLLIFFLITR